MCVIIKFKFFCFCVQYFWFIWNLYHIQALHSVITLNIKIGFHHIWWLANTRTYITFYNSLDLLILTEHISKFSTLMLILRKWRLQEKMFECRSSDFHILNAWSLCDNHIWDYSFRQAKESVKKWLINLILKDVKSCFDDDFWVHANMFLKHMMSQTQNSCQNRLSKFEFHSSITVSLQKSHKLLSVRWSYAIA